MASIDDGVSLQNVEGLGVKAALDTQYPYSPLTPTSLIEDLPNDYRQPSATVGGLEPSYSQRLPSGRIMSPNVERGSVHFLSLDGEFAGEFDPSANAASYRAQEPQASGSGSAPQVESKRERNRKAARKCRQKAKVNVEWLKDEERELARQNRELKCIAGGLREEVLGLKNELLTHSQYCDSEPIKRYLAKVAGDLINRDLN